MDDKYALIHRAHNCHYHYFKDIPASRHHILEQNKKFRKKQSDGHTHENYRHPFEISSSSSHQPKPCDGFGNFLIDVGVVSYIFGVVSAGLGLYTLALAFINQFVAYFTAYFISSPSSILTLITLVTDNEFVEALNILWGLSSVVDTGVNVFIGLPFNDHINYVSALAEFLGIVSLLIGIASTFPDLFEEFLETFIDPHEYFKEYGCESENYVNAGEGFFNQLIETLF